MNSTRSGVSRRDIHSAGQRALETEIELHDVRRLQVVIDRLKLRLDGSVGVELRDDVGERRVGESRASRKRWIQASREEVILRQNLVVENTESGAHRRLSVAERVPGDSHSR